jgi:hypothetical protein
VTLLLPQSTSERDTIPSASHFERAIGIGILLAILGRADEVIE